MVTLKYDTGLSVVEIKVSNLKDENTIRDFAENNGWKLLD